MDIDMDMPGGGRGDVGCFGRWKVGFGVFGPWC